MNIITSWFRHIRMLTEHHHSCRRADSAADNIEAPNITLARFASISHAG